MPNDLLPIIAGPFVLKAQIATGASSTVYSARNTESAQTVALSVLKHPNIVQLIRPWTVGSQFFLELEMVEGLTLKEWSVKHPPEWIEPHLYILAQVARALGAVHEQQILHRDLKPENILVSPEGVAKLTDFGLARSEFFRQQLTQTGSLIGSLAYMAPETIDGKPATFASDIFSFGIVAYEILCGKHPFMDSSGQIIMKNLMAAECTPISKKNPRVPLKIAQLLDTCLRKEPEDRPNSIWLVEASLMDFLQMSGQMMRVKEWMKTGNPDLFSAALTLKHSILKNDIHLELARGTERSVILAKINQFHALFPNDPALETMMSAITQAAGPRHSKRKISLVFMLILLTFGILTYLLALPQKRHAAVTNATPPTLSAGDDDSKTEAVVMANPSLLDPIPIEAQLAQAPPVEKPVDKIAKSEEKKLPQTATGHLRLIIDKGVSAFVDGRRISSSELSDYKIKAGRYTLVLEKPGYMAIERMVTVRSGKITTVNARSEPQ